MLGPSWSTKNAELLAVGLATRRPSSGTGRGGPPQAVAFTLSQNLGLTFPSSHILSLSPIRHGKKQ